VESKPEAVRLDRRRGFHPRQARPLSSNLLNKSSPAVRFTKPEKKVQLIPGHYTSLTTGWCLRNMGVCFEISCAPGNMRPGRLPPKDWTAYSLLLVGDSRRNAFSKLRAIAGVLKSPARISRFVESRP